MASRLQLWRPAGRVAGSFAQLRSATPFLAYVMCHSAIMRRDRVPSHAAFQAAIDGTGFDLKLDPFYRPLVSEGFHPCKFGDRETSLEIMWQPTDEIREAFPHLMDDIGDRDICLTFILHSEMVECAAAMMASAALACEFDAFVLYQDEEIVYTPEQLIEEAKAALADASRTRPRR